MRPVAPTRSRVVSLKGSVGCRPIQADYDEGFAAPDIFGPYGWEDGNNPGTGLIYQDPAPQLTIPASDAFVGTRAAQFHYLIDAAGPASRDSNVRVMFDASAFNLEHFFIRGYVKFPSASFDWAAPSSISRKLLYLKSDHVNNTTWNMVLGGFDLDTVLTYTDPAFPGEVPQTNLNPSPYYVFPLDAYRGIEWEVQLNTGGNHDGYIRVWIYNPDGTTILSETWSGLQLRGSGSSAKLDWVEWGDQCNRDVTGVVVDEYRQWDQIALSSRRIGPVVGAGTSGFTAFDLGVDFSNTATFVTHPASCVPCANDVYKTPRLATSPALTHAKQGWVLGSTSAADINAALDPRLAGAVWRSHTLGAGQDTFKLDLPYPVGGTYTIRLALGADAIANYPYVEVRDGVSGPVLFTIQDAVGSGVGQFYDANGVIRTSAADWVTNNTSRSITLSGSQLVINLKYLSPLTGVRNHISHLRLTRTG